MTENVFPEVGDTVPALKKSDINPVTGAVELVYQDYSIRTIGGVYSLMRWYAPGKEDKDMSQPLGSHWQLNAGGKIRRKGDKVWLPTDELDFQWEAFFLDKGVWRNANGRSRYQLQQRRTGFLARDTAISAEYSFDEQGNFVGEKVHGAIRMEVSYYDDMPVRIVIAGGMVVSIVWDKTRLLSLTDSMGRKITYQYDGDLLIGVKYPGGGTLRYEYDHLGRLTRAFDRCGKEIFCNTYDEDNRVTEQKRNGQVFKYRHNIRAGGRSSLVMNENTLDYRRYYWNPKGEIYRLVDEEGGEEFTFYNEWGKVTRFFTPNEEEFLWKYDAECRLKQEVLPSGLTKYYTYDSNSRLVNIKDNMDSEISFSYNERSCVCERRTRLNERNWRVENWEWDLKGRITAYICNGAKTRYAYDEDSPYPVIMETPCGDTFRYHYDKAGRLLSIQSPLGEKRISYNDLDLVTRIEDALGHDKTYRYDLEGNISGEKPEQFMFPGMPYSHYATPNRVSAYNKQENKLIFDQKGQLLEARNKETNELLALFSYDIAGRLEEVRERNAPGEYHLRKIRYDANDNILEERIWLNPQGETGTRGRIYIIRYEYDAQGRRINMSDNNNEAWEYEYNALSLVTWLKHRRQDKQTDVTNYIYDAAGRLIGVKEKADYSATGKLWQNTFFDLDADGHCYKVRVDDSAELTGDDAARCYDFVKDTLPWYPDVSGYV